ncbi:2133_t:CDS:2, partial [Gigaspora margarita]
LFIPFTIIADLGWSTIFVVQIITFIFFGISIVDPFDYEELAELREDLAEKNYENVLISINLF